MFKKLLLFSFFLISMFALSQNSFAADKIKIVATTSTLGSITQEIAKDRADVYSIASPKRDIHFYHPTPKDVLKVKKADVLVHSGLDLEVWRPPLLDAVGRPELMATGNKAIDVSKGIALVEIPTGLSRAQGDIHAFGNPHYWLDPENAKIIANNIAGGLATIFPEDADFFKSNQKELNRKLEDQIKDWTKRMAPYRDTPVVTYHRSWPYFLKRFGLVTLGELEPKPGIPPTAKHLAQLTRLMKERQVKLILKESFQENRTPEKVAKATGAKVVTLAQAVRENSEASDYSSMMEYNVGTLEKALAKK